MVMKVGGPVQGKVQGKSISIETHDLKIDGQEATLVQVECSPISKKGPFTLTNNHS